MFKFIFTSGTAAISLMAAVMASTGPAQAQVGIEIGPGGVRAYEQRREYRPVIERRERRVIVEEDDEEVCRYQVRRRVNARGDVVTRRVRICE